MTWSVDEDNTDDDVEQTSLKELLIIFGRVCVCVCCFFGGVDAFFMDFSEEEKKLFFDEEKKKNLFIWPPSPNTSKKWPRKKNRTEKKLPQIRSLSPLRFGMESGIVMTGIMAMTPMMRLLFVVAPVVMICGRSVVARLRQLWGVGTEWRLIY